MVLFCCNYFTAEQQVQAQEAWQEGCTFDINLHVLQPEQKRYMEHIQQTFQGYIVHFKKLFTLLNKKTTYKMNE